MRDLRLSWAIETQTPYLAILGEGFASLHPHVQAAHLVPLAAEGTMDVERGASLGARLLARFLGFPAAGLGQRVRLDVRPFGGEVEWHRSIGKSRLRTYQFAKSGYLVERNRTGMIVFKLIVRDGALVYEQVAMKAARAIVPRGLAPTVRGLVSPTPEGWRVEVEITWRGRLVGRYSGALKAV